MSTHNSTTQFHRRSENILSISLHSMLNKNVSLKSIEAKLILHFEIPNEFYHLFLYTKKDLIKKTSAYK